MGKRRPAPGGAQLDAAGVLLFAGVEGEALLSLLALVVSAGLAVVAVLVDVLPDDSAAGLLLPLDA